MLKLSVIIINYGSSLMTKKAIHRFLAMEPNLDSEIILIDNKSSEDLDEKIFQKLGCKVIKNVNNLGFAKAVNQGIKASKGDYILFLNSDAFITKNAVSELIDYMNNNVNIGAIGPRMIYPDGRFQISFGCFPSFWREFLRLSSLFKIIPKSTLAANTLFKKIDLKNSKEVDWLTGGCLLVRRKVIEDIGALDEKYFLGVEDIDFCYRVKQAKYKIVYYPLAKVCHYHGCSSGLGGTRSIMRIKYDKEGFDYFMEKHFSKKIFSRLAIRWMHNLKILAVKLTGQKQ